MSCSSSATPPQPTDSILRLHDTMKFLESRRCSKSTRSSCRNNLPLLQSWDLKEGIWVDSKIYSPNCHWGMWFSGSDQVNDAKCSGLAHNWAYMASAPKPFWSCFFTPHVSVSLIFSSSVTVSPQITMTTESWGCSEHEASKHSACLQGPSNNHPDPLLNCPEFTLIKVMGPQLLEALGFTPT